MGGGGEGRAFLSEARRIAAAPDLPAAAEFAALSAAARAALDAAPASLRPPGPDGLPGGLLELPELPVVLLPDLHARPDFLAAALGWAPPLAGLPAGKPLAELLARGEACLLLLGDLFHGEAGEAPARWRLAFEEFQGGYAGHAAMDEEMGLSLAVARIVLRGLAAFPDRFFCLKGNHDNLPAESLRGDRCFRKYVQEGSMVAAWFRGRYGEELLRAYRGVELALPVAARRRALPGAFVASHGEPGISLSAADIVAYRSRPDTVYALIWTANDEAAEGSVEASLQDLLGPGATGPRWFGGHRPVRGRWMGRAGGRYVQFHDPAATRVLLLDPGRAPDPDRDLLDL